jgi:hypothetical protein
MARQIINSGSAPITWSAVDEAFKKINDNFVELYLSVGGGSAIDLTALSTNIIPSETETYDLGSLSKRWRDLYLSGSSIYLGDALITSVDGAVQLPAGSSIGGLALDEKYFKTISVGGQADIVADEGTDTLTINSGNGISIVTNEETDTLTISNSGVTSAQAGTGINVNSSVGNVTFTNTGVTQLIGTAGQIGVSNATGVVTLTNLGVTRLQTDPGSGITLSANAGVIQITNSAPNIVQDVFRNIQISGQDIVSADGNNDTLTLIASTGLSITTNAGVDAITFVNTGVTSLSASSGISLSAGTGSVIVSNTGVTELAAGPGISLSGSTGNVTITNSKVGFTSIAVQGQSPILADNVSDTLVLIAGVGIEFLSDPATDSITISANANLESNLYGADSTLLVDAENSKIVGEIDSPRIRTSEDKVRIGLAYDFANPVDGPAQYTVAVGTFAGEIRQENMAIAIGHIAGNEDQRTHAIAVGVNSGGQRQSEYAAAFGVEAGYRDQGRRSLALGYQAGAFNQGDEAVAIGYRAGNDNQAANSIIINASGVALNGSAAGFYVNPIRNLNSGSILTYDTTTKEIGYSDHINIVGDVKGSVFADDSTILVDAVNGIIPGYISVATLKSIAASSSTYEDFQTAIAAL